MVISITLINVVKSGKWVETKNEKKKKNAAKSELTRIFNARHISIVLEQSKIYSSLNFLKLYRPVPIENLNRKKKNQNHGEKVKIFSTAKPLTIIFEIQVSITEL